MYSIAVFVVVFIHCVVSFKNSIWPLFSRYDFRNIISKLQSGYTVKPISSEKWLEPYSPYYDAETHSLYFCELFNDQRALNRFDLNENQFYSASIEGNITCYFFIPIENQIDQFAISNGNSVEIVE